MGRRRRNKYPKRYCTLNWLKCIGLTKTGKGIVIYHDKEFHVDELIAGEEARILVYYEEDEIGTARAVEIRNESRDRVLPLGHWKFSLGSYHIPHLSNEAQDKFKQKRIAKYWPNAKSIIVGKREFYRNKVSLTNGGFMPPGRGRRRHTIKDNRFDLMKINFDKYNEYEGVWIIRELLTRIEGKPGTKIYAKDEMLGKKFNVGLDSFYQVNSQMAEIAYREIIKNVPNDSVVFDLFGGAATIGIHVSDRAKKVYSVEINKDSHEDALRNIELNNATNVEAIMADANEWIRNTKLIADVVIVDPARAGLSELSAEMINKCDAKKIIYLSCNIETQYKDIKHFDNYEIEFVQPYDFFPQTFHIENLIVLKKKK